MWFEYEYLDDPAQRFSRSLGKALALAQSFESNCKFVLLIANINKEIESGTITSLPEIQSYSEKLETWFKLGGGVTQFKDRHNISANEVEILRNGKEARNFIAHEAAHPMLHGKKASREIIVSLPRFRINVRNLATAENLISRWSYMIQEKDSPPVQYSNAYAERVCAWVLSDVDEYTPNDG